MRRRSKTGNVLPVPKLPTYPQYLHSFGFRQAIDVLANFFQAPLDLFAYVDCVFPRQRRCHHDKKLILYRNVRAFYFMQTVHFAFCFVEFANIYQWIFNTGNHP
ncbi:hypothetical protein [Azospirillum doebereinerae]